MNMLLETLDLDLGSIRKRTEEGAVKVLLSLWAPDGQRDAFAQFDTVNMTPEQIAEQITERTTRAVRVLTGLQRIHVAFIDAHGDPIGILPVSIMGGAGETEFEGGETGDTKSVVSQVQRQNEALHKLVRDYTHAFAGRAVDVEKRLQARVNQLEAEREGLLALREDVLDRRQERELKAREAEARIKGITRIVETIVPAAIAVVNKVSGRELVQQTRTIDELLVFELASRMDDPLYVEFFARLPPQDMLLWQTLAELAEKRARLLDTDQKMEVDQRIRDAIYGLLRTDTWKAQAAKHSKGDAGKGDGSKK